MPECLRCGKCCHYTDRKGHQSPCPFLQKIGGKTRCRKYYSRLGTPMGNGWYCGERKYSKYDYVGCPFNTNKELLTT